MWSTISRPWALGAALLLAAGCAEESTVPFEAERDGDAPAPAFATLLTCTVQVGEDGGMGCEPAAGTSAAGAPGGPNLDLVVGSQHHFVRLANTTPTVASGVWSADVTVQNLTLQPMATLDGTTAEAEGVRVFFVDGPNNSVVVSNHDGTAAFTGSESQKYYQYAGAELGGDQILTSGETSAAKTWEFTLNGTSTFQFSVLISTPVPDEGAYGVHLVRVSAGGAHTCGGDSDGNLYCWGKNDSGQLGDGTTDPRRTPVAVDVSGLPPTDRDLSDVSAGAHHTCASRLEGDAYCWGNNIAGQLGDDMASGSASDVPVEVIRPQGVAFHGIQAGAFHTCSNSAQGNAYCWGDNSDGQLGNGTTNLSKVPVPLSKPAEVFAWLSLVTAQRHTCATANSNDGVYCWGDNGTGQLGDGTTGESSTPVPVNAPGDVTLSNVTAGIVHTCAEGSNGNAYCWGDNVYGQLGDGSTTTATTPVLVSAPGDVTLSGPAAGGSHTCALGSDGQAYCWGDNGSGQLGDGTNVAHPTPQPVSAPAGVSFTALSAGTSHTCALSDAGPVYCWGANGDGQLGDGTTVDRLAPVIVAGTQ